MEIIKRNLAATGSEMAVTTGIHAEVPVLLPGKEKEEKVRNEQK